MEDLLYICSRNTKSYTENLPKTTKSDEEDEELAGYHNRDNLQRRRDDGMQQGR
jgi:hypothetical protein